MQPSHDCANPTNSSGNKMIRELDIAANALSTNKDATRVVVAGRNLLKIFSIEENSFREEHNLKVGKQASLNFSSLDVAWSPNEEHIIASAATNGAVVLWNVNRVAKNKADTMCPVHKRTVNKVVFHHTDASILLSGSQDATIKLFDLRERAAVVHTFENGNDSVRDIQFSPHISHLFVSADEAGNVKCWDLRNVERPTKQFTAHTGPLLSLDFHPQSNNKHLVATAGRDKLIKVWNIESDKPNVAYSVQTIAPVNKVKWRPNREWHIASCSLVIDCSIHVWDIRRPFMPFASFEEHKDVATGIAWRHDPHNFLSCGKDGILIQHLFRDACRPADFANPAGLDVGPYGDIACAFSNDILQSTVRQSNGTSTKFGGIPGLNRIRSAVMNSSSNQQPSSQQPTVNQQPQQQQQQQQQHQKQSEQFRAPHTSSLYVNMLMDSSDKVRVLSTHQTSTIADETMEAYHHISMDWFIKTATQYRLTGKSLAEICAHNAKVAFALERPQVANSWLILQCLYDASSLGRCGAIGGGAGSAFVLAGSDFGDTYSQGGGDQSTLGDTSATTITGPVGAGGGSVVIDSSELVDDDRVGQLDFPKQPQKTSTTMAPRLPSNMNADLFFGDGELGKIVFDEFEALRLFQNVDHEWKLQHEAFEPRPSLVRTNSDLTSETGGGASSTTTATTVTTTTSASNEADLQQLCSSGGSPSVHESTETSANISTTSSSSNRTTTAAKVPVQARPKNLLQITAFGRRVAPLPYSGLIQQMLNFYADNGDVQMAATVMLVLGAKGRHLVDDYTQRMWFSAYIELLDRFQLSNIAALVIRLCQLPEINMISQESTSITLTCSQCEKPLTRGGWWCDRCQQATSICGVCKASTKGLYAWCLGCGHGGHLHHLREWFVKHNYCPSGCGHICEFSDN